MLTKEQMYRPHIKGGMLIRMWTEEEDNYLREHYSNEKIEDISQHLDRSINSIKTRLSILRIKRTKHRFTVSEDFYIRRWYYKKSCSELAEDLGIDTDVVMHRIKYLKLNKR